MKFLEVNKEDAENYFFRDVNKYVEKKMREMIKAAIEKGRIVDWDKFKEYCLEYFELPEYTIENGIGTIKEEITPDGFIKV